MKRDELNDMAAFVTVADERSFTRAAAKLGMSPSGLSHAMRGLETRLGLRLLARTTRSVAPTEAGEGLLRALRPAFADIEVELKRLGGLRDKPAGTVRVTTFKYAATRVLWPALPAFLETFPDIIVEVNVDSGLTDIVTSRYDAGIRFGEQVAKDMIAVRVGPDVRLAVVATPGYFARHSAPVTPDDLARHRCINFRLPTGGGLLPWEFEREGRRLQVRPEGPLVFDDADLLVLAVLAGQGVGYAIADEVADHIAAGRLVSVMQDWCPTYTGCHLYYPSRRQMPPALVVLIEALRFRGSVMAPSA